MAFSATDRRLDLVSHEIIYIPVGDSLHHHIKDFKEILTNMGIPGIMSSDILFKIATKARGMDTCNGVFLTVGVVETVYQEIRIHDEEDDISRAERELMEVEAKPIPATKSSIDALERVVFDGLVSARDCTVCMEDIEAGSEAIRMPWSHKVASRHIDGDNEESRE
ncbi:unnamed protein product [Dovyalis caffra]|uniref:Uncharacterized protein n=1 Tax=Dovyalis caffra TaxID=77055 RepID=A0AAV1SRI1_9ROSI|nr:unnamed protein product [Dovyalis caffra]